MICVLAGGVGAARLLSGMVKAVEPSEITAVINTGDDVELWGLHVSPDIDTITYTLAGVVNPETGWGLTSETWETMGALERLGAPTWFRLGDRDLATHMYRTRRLREGASLSEVTGELARRWGIAVKMLPVTDGRLRTRVTVDGAEIGFQDYFVRLRHSVPVEAIRFEGAEDCVPAPGVLDAIEGAELVVIAPSNPLVSIGPLLAVPEIAEAVSTRRSRTVAVSPIIAGAALKGPADRLLTELGHECSSTGVARIYAGLASTLVVDSADAGLAEQIEAEGLECVVTPTVMRGTAEATALAHKLLEVAG